MAARTVDAGPWSARLRSRAGSFHGRVSSVACHNATAAAAIDSGRSWIRIGLLAGLAVDRLAQQVGVAVVPGVLLDHVGEDPAQRRPALPVPGGMCRTQRVVADGERCADDLAGCSDATRPQ